MGKQLTIIWCTYPDSVHYNYCTESLDTGDLLNQDLIEFPEFLTNEWKFVFKTDRGPVYNLQFKVPTLPFVPYVEV